MEHYNLSQAAMEDYLTMSGVIFENRIPIAWDENPLPKILSDVRLIDAAVSGKYAHNG